MSSTRKRPSANDYAQRIDRIEREAKGKAASVINGVRMRHDHPSYGYTKTSLRRDLHVLQGMLLAWAIMTGVIDYPGTPTMMPAVQEAIQDKLGIDVQGLYNLINAS